MKYLISNGADPFTTNTQGINMLHVGAQGDQPITIAYFLGLGLDIDSKDQRQSTPLHWAAFAGSFLVLQYLVSLKAEVNCQDIKGLTPLHLAVKIAVEYRSISSIKALLMKKADCNMRDQQGNLAEDFIQDYDRSDATIAQLASEVYELVHEEPETFFQRYNPFKGCECFATKYKFQKNGKNPKTFQCYFVLMFLSFLLLNFIVFPCILGVTIRKADQSQNVSSRESLNATNSYLDDKDLSLWGTDKTFEVPLVMQAGLFILSVAFNYILSVKDPGYLKIHKG